jgi:hypothetical protein
MNNEILLKYFADTLASIEQLLADVPAERLAEQPAGLPNHPAWTLAHLCVGHGFALSMLGQPPLCPEAWQANTGPGSKPAADRAQYPDKAEALAVLRQQHAALTAAVRAAKPEAFDAPTPERVRPFAPTVGHVVAYMLACHENNHLGQLQAWKRAAGLVK